MAEYTKEEIEKAKEDIRKMSEKTRSEPAYKGKEYSETGPKPGVKQGGFGGGAGMPKINRDITKNYKSGGTASSRADGCATKGKTKGRMV